MLRLRGHCKEISHVIRCFKTLFRLNRSFLWYALLIETQPSHTLIFIVSLPGMTEMSRININNWMCRGRYLIAWASVEGSMPKDRSLSPEAWPNNGQKRLALEGEGLRYLIELYQSWNVDSLSPNYCQISGKTLFAEGCGG
jgi:hypothetical protein